MDIPMDVSMDISMDASMDASMDISMGISMDISISRSRFSLHLRMQGCKEWNGVGTKWVAERRCFLGQTGDIWSWSARLSS